ncbi:MAG: pilus assembly protein [Hyphomicrobiales bacterium]|nr:pilus assembly protein [Hyphomicrobiales bacterium]
MSLIQSIKSFLPDRRGNFAIMFAIVAPVLLIGVAGAIDYTRALNLQSNMQQAADAAALAAATAARNGLSEAAAQTIADRVYLANLDTTNFDPVTNPVPDLNVTIEKDENGATATVGGSGTLQDTMFNMSDWTPEVQATAIAEITGETSYGYGQETNGKVREYEDPYYAVYDGAGKHVKTLDIHCKNGAWQTFLADAGVQLNAFCRLSWLRNQNWDSFLKLDAQVDGHRVEMSIPGVNEGGINASVAIDGKRMGTATGRFYLTGGPSISMTTKNGWTIQNSTTNGWGAGQWALRIANDHWDIRLTFTHGGAEIFATANNAGMCGPVKGIMGDLMAGNFNPDLHVVPSGDTLSPEYSWEPECKSGTAVARLTK